MKKTTLATALSISLCASFLAVTIPAQAADADVPNAIPSQRFIVKYQDKSAAAATVNSAGKSDVIAQLKSSDKEAVKEAADAVSAKVNKSTAMAGGAAKVTLDKRLSKAESAKFIKELSADPSVDFVEPDLWMTSNAANPNDPKFNEMWGLGNTKVGIGVTGAWDKSKGKGVVVGVIDTGITKHPDLDANILPGFDMISDAGVANDGDGRDSDASDTGDAVRANECGVGKPRRDQGSSWHGTHVSGTIAAVTNNGQGVAGIAPDAKVVPVRVLGKCGGLSSDISDGITWASGGDVPGLPRNPHPAQVLNLSLGGPSDVCPAVYQRAIDAAVARGTTVVVAAGNETDDARRYTPSNCKNVVVVGATGEQGNQSEFSNYGPAVDLMAPGGDFSTGRGILSTINTGRQGPASPGYREAQGTSMAAPHVAGVAALVKAADKNATPAQIKQKLVSSVKKMGVCTNAGCGSGLLDAAAAVGGTSGGTDPEPSPKPTEPGQPSPKPTEPGQPTPKPTEPGQPSPEPGLREVRAATPTAYDNCGTYNDVLVLPRSTGVEYEVNGTVYGPGQYRASGTLTIVAKAKPGYKIVGNAKWRATFTNYACSYYRYF